MPPPITTTLDWAASWLGVLASSGFTPQVYERRRAAPEAGIQLPKTGDPTKTG